MTDKIIIDNVDVSGCKGIDLSLYPLVQCKLLEFKTEGGGTAGYWCHDHTYCDYKQLKRKEEECEIFHKANDEKNEFLQKLGISGGGEFRRIKYYIDKLQEQNKSLQRELRTEKEKVRKLEEKLFQIESVVKPINEELPEDNIIREIMLILNDCCGLTPSRYKQALEEIKEIAEDFENCYGSDYAHIKQILQECEVLGD